MSGPTPSRTARRPTTGCRSSAAPPGSGTPRRLQYYLHNFLASSRTSTSTRRRCRTRCSTSTRFWLERGVDGFRLDTINFYFHSAGLEDNPALPESERNDSTAPAVNPYNYQDHLYDKSQPENLAFLERFRALLDEYPATAAVGEVGDGQRGLEIVAAYTAGGERCRCATPSISWAPKRSAPARSAPVLETFGKVGARRLAVLGLLQP